MNKLEKTIAIVQLAISTAALVSAIVYARTNSTVATDTLGWLVTTLFVTMLFEWGYRILKPHLTSHPR